MAESPILIDVWTVEPEQQDALVHAIRERLGRLIADRPGFVSADIYQSANRDMVLLTVRMQSASDRRDLTDDPRIQQVFRELGRTATSHTHVYRLAESIRAPGRQPER